MPARMTMNLANPNTQLRQNMAAYAASIAPSPLSKARPVALNAPMIDRVHKAKPGCSACGKKVA
jgi:hypothetical protein